jgi:DNA-binding transcriptional regulator YiaG
MVRGAQQERVLPVYDASAFVGLWAIVYNAAIEWQEDDGEVSIELPKLPELLAAATISRCLMPAKLRGAEIKAIRRIMNLTLVDLAEALDGRPETISRWESEAQPMGAYAEKVLRLLACRS